MSSGKVTVQDEMICIMDGATVYKGLYGTESVGVAVKVDKKPNIQQIDRNLEVLLNVRHPNIIQVIEQYISNGCHYLVLERFTGLNIFQYISNISTPFKRATVVSQIAKQLVNALIYLHYNKIFCNGIKPGGIVITQLPPEGASKEIEESMPIIVKLVDFSGSIIFNRGMDETLLKYSKFYAAPELASGVPSKEYTTEPDIYALGATVHFLLCGQPIQKDGEGNGALSSSFNSMFRDAADFILSCTKKNLLDRPTAKDLLDHRFIKEQKKAINIKKLQKRYGVPNLKKFDMTSKILGKGGFGEVRLGFVKKTDVPVALKIIKVKDTDLMALEREISIMMSLNHPNICKCYGFELDWMRIYLGVELAEGGDLYGYLLSLNDFTEADASDLIKQILDALVYLEEQKIGHYDLKPENILIKNIIKHEIHNETVEQQPVNADETGIVQTAQLSETQGKMLQKSQLNVEKPILLLADFGTAVLREQYVDETIICGTPQYIAPEVMLHDKGFSTQPDVYALAAIAYIMCCGEFPFSGGSNLDVMRAQVAGNWNKNSLAFQALSPECKDFITQAFTQDWKKRPKASQLIKHKFITSPDKVKKLKSINVLQESKGQDQHKEPQFRGEFKQ